MKQKEFSKLLVEMCGDKKKLSQSQALEIIAIVEAEHKRDLNKIIEKLEKNRVEQKDYFDNSFLNWSIEKLIEKAYDDEPPF